MANIEKIKVPDIGGATDVDVIEVLVNVGDSIQKDDSIITLESDKASMEIPAPKSGVVKELELKVGDKVSEGDIILMLETDTEKVESSDKTEKKEDSKKEQQDEIDKEQQPQKQKTEKEAEIKEVKVPDIGTSEAVDVIEISVSAGDTIEKESTLLTLESDKASMELPAPFAGKVKEVKVSIGDKVKEGDLILLLETSEKVEVQEKAKVKEEKTITPEAKQIAKEKETEAEKGGVAKSYANVFAGPGVRRLARELGVDLTKVQGSGNKGRITKTDIQGFVKKVMTGQSTGVGLSMAAAPEIDFSKFGETEIKPLAKIKRLTGQNVHRSWVTVPHVTQFDEADITEMEAFRKSNKAIAEKQGFKLTPLVFIMKAVIKAMQKFPSFNSSLDSKGENLIFKKYFHIGVAVDTPNGLVVPVIRDVDKKSLFDLAKELGQISNKAREKGLGLNDMQGSCMTISSLGGISGTAFTPIVNTPDVAILGVSKAKITPVYENDAFVPRLMLPLSLSYDHRVIDGAQAARFTKMLSELLGDIRKLLL